METDKERLIPAITPEIQARVKELSQVPWWETVQFLPADYQGDQSSLIRVETEKGELVGYLVSDEELPVMAHILPLVSFPSDMVRAGAEHWLNNTLTLIAFGAQEGVDKSQVIKEAMERIDTILKTEKAKIERFHFRLTPLKDREREYLTLRLIGSQGEEIDVFARATNKEELTKVWQQLGQGAETHTQTIALTTQDLASRLKPLIQPLIALEEDEVFQKQVGEDWVAIAPGVNQLKEINSRLEAVAKGNFSVAPQEFSPLGGQSVALRPE